MLRTTRRSPPAVTCIAVVLGDAGVGGSSSTIADLTFCGVAPGTTITDSSWRRACGGRGTLRGLPPRCGCWWLLISRPPPVLPPRRPLLLLLPRPRPRLPPPRLLLLPPRPPRPPLPLPLLLLLPLLCLLSSPPSPLPSPPLLPVRSARDGAATVALRSLFKPSATIFALPR